MTMANNNELQTTGLIEKRFVIGNNYYIKLDSDNGIFFRIRKDPFELLEDGDKISIRSKLHKEKINNHIHPVANVFYFELERK